jgi:ArsR family transcriptional regulator
MLLQEHGELCVCELIQALNRSQPHVSHHLAKLRKEGIIQDRRQGLWVHYRLHPDLPDWALGVMREAAQGTRLPSLGERPATLSPLPWATAEPPQMQEQP